MTEAEARDSAERVLLLMPTLTYRAGAFLEAAQRLAIPVAVGAEHEHVLAELNPSGNLQVDFNDLEGSTDRIVEFADRYPLRAIVSTDDEGVELAAMASQALNLRHSPLLAVRSARDKYQTRRALQMAGMRVPAYRRLSLEADLHQAAQEVSYPCVVKPLDLAGSRGVMRADDPDHFVLAVERLKRMLARGAHAEAALAPTAQSPESTHPIQGSPEMAIRAAKLKHFLVEDYIPGIEVAVEGLLVDGQLLVLAIFDKPDPLEGPFFEETLYVTPSRHPQFQQEEIVAATGTAVAALGLNEGPIHAEMRVNEQGVWILEVAPRSIGGYCSRALRFERGEGLEERILEHALGRKLGDIRLARPASGVMMVPIPTAGVLCEVRGVEAARQVPGISELRIAIPIGGKVVPLPEGSQYLGFIFAHGEGPDEVEVALRQAHHRLEFEILPPEQASRWEAGNALRQ